MTVLVINTLSEWQYLPSAALDGGRPALGPRAGPRAAAAAMTIGDHRPARLARSEAMVLFKTFELV